MAVNVYGAGWCGDTRASRAVLDELGISYQYHDIDTDPKAAAFVREHNAGKQKLPTIDVGGKILSIPDDETLAAALKDA